MNPKIQQITDLIPMIEDRLNEIDVDLASSRETGLMDGRELKKALKAVVSDIKRLTRSDHLILYFTDREIDTLYISLTEIESEVPFQPAVIAASLDALRPLVRSYWIRSRSQAEAEQIQIRISARAKITGSHAAVA